MNRKMEIDTNSDADKTNGAKNSNRDSIEKPKEPFNLKKFILSIFTFFTVEPFLLFYVIPAVLTGTAMQFFNMEKACRADLQMSEEICKAIVSGEGDNSTEEIKTQAQILVADMTAWRDPLQTGIPAIFILLVGAWSDRTGNRKALLLIPVVGEMCSLVGLLLGTYFFLEWPLWLMGLIQAMSSIFTGGLSVAIMGSYSYLADVTTPESRTFRIGVAALIVTLGVPLGAGISGSLTVNFGYYGVFGISLALFALAFIHTLFRVHDVKRIKQEGSFGQQLLHFFHPKNVWDTLSLLFMKRGMKLIQVILVIWAHIVIMGPVQGEGVLLYLYVLQRYNMDPETFSLYSTYNVLIGIVGTAIAVTIFSKWLGMHDSMLGIIATASKVASSLVYGFASTKEIFFAGPVFDIFGSSGVTAIRSLGTKVVEPNEVGRMVSLIGFIDSIVPVIYVPLYTKLYTNTISTTPGAIYFVGSAMTVPDFFVFIAVYLIYKKQQRDIVQHPETKEMHVYENDVTAL
ncbi:hypothetical protein ABMA27_006095 [Loxostege sticticalis]|uniref:Proton-coupled folate transporter n=1 Tax=Loxostege sticticalis TaxID=481309 RepID=A0ABR3HHK6_LOXSC